jgi:hypothetical protein
LLPGLGFDTIEPGLPAFPGEPVPPKPVTLTLYTPAGTVNVPDELKVTDPGAALPPKFRWFKGILFS